MSHLDQAAAPATVDKTPEQREAERQQKLRTEKLAGWAEQAAVSQRQLALSLLQLDRSIIARRASGLTLWMQKRGRQG